MKEVASRYPEFAHLDFDVANQLKEQIKSCVSVSVCNEANTLFSISKLTQRQINSATMSQAWTKSKLRVDFANETTFKKGWHNVGKILMKRKGVSNYVNSSDEMINRYLLYKFKTDRNVIEKNPFLKSENPKTDMINRIKKFIHNRYHIYRQSSKDIERLKSKEFQEFKSQFDIEGMKIINFNIQARQSDSKVGLL